MIDREQTLAWAAARAESGLTPDSTNFGRTALSSAMSEVGAVLSVLPSDPRHNNVDFTDELFTVLPERFTGITANAVSALHASRRTATAATRFATDGRDQLRAYVAVRRDGGVEVGVDGDTAYYNAQDNSPRIYRLFVLVHLVRQVVETQSRLLHKPTLNPPGEPFQLVLAIPGAAGAVLGGFADGWRDVSQMFGQTQPSAADTFDPLVVMDVDPWPTNSDEEVTLIERFATRVCDAFNDASRRFRPAPNHGDSDHLDPAYA